MSSNVTSPCSNVKKKVSHGFQSLRSIWYDGVMFWFLAQFRFLCVEGFSWSIQEQKTFDMKLKLDDESCRRIVCIWWMNFSELEFHSLRSHTEPWRFCFCLPAVAGRRSMLFREAGIQWSANSLCRKNLGLLILLASMPCSMFWRSSGNASAWPVSAETRVPTKTFHGFLKSCA